MDDRLQSYKIRTEVQRSDTLPITPPCWSYDDHDELWSRKHCTTGFNAQLICLLDGYAVYISDPLPGCTHDAKAFTTTPVAEIVEKSGGGIGGKGYQGCYRHPTEDTPRWRAQQGRQSEQRRHLSTAGTRGKTRRPFRIMADLPHRLSSTVPHLP